jgi:protein O-GlcNAc transferase
MNYENDIAHIRELISFNKHELAKKLLDKLYKTNPKNFFLENFYGAFLALDNQNVDAAIECFKKSIDLNDKFSEPYYNIARIYFNKGKYLECEDLLNTSIYLDKENFHYKSLLGQTYIKLKKYDDAIILFSTILKDQIDKPEPYYNLGISYASKGEPAKAIFFLEKSILFGINFSQAYIDLANCYDETKSNYYANFQLTSKGVKLHSSSSLYTKHAKNLFRFGKIDEGFFYAKKAITLDPDNLNHYYFYLFYLNYKTEDILNEYSSLVSEFKKKYLISNKFEKHNFILKCEKKIKLGFVSYDFRDHVVMYQLFDIIKELYERNNFILYAYYNHEINDETTNIIKKYFHYFINISNMNDSEVTDKIRKDEIFILFDLSGYTTGNRLGVFIQRSAPIQISWAGYLNTTCLEEIDYIIGDENIFKNNDQHYLEKKINLPHAWTNLSNLGLPDLDKVSKTTPAVYNKYLTFGCFSNVNKMNKDFINFIINVLKSLPNSKIIFQSDLFNDVDFNQYFCEPFYRANIKDNRIVLLGSLQRDKFLLNFNEIDIILDTFPYGGGTTSLEASWMCVPILTMEGKTFLSRCGVSINLNLGLNEFIYKSENDAINLLKKFDDNYSDLQLFKERLFKQKNSCKLFDTKTFVIELSDKLYNLINNQR